MQVLIDHKIFTNLQKMHVVESQYDFSRLMGKSDGYFSSLQCKQTPMSVSALAKLVFELRKLSTSEPNERKKSVLSSLTDTLSSEIYRRVAA
jgi:hypothetical protein